MLCRWLGGRQAAGCNCVEHGERMVAVAVGETVTLLHHPLPSVGVSVGMTRGVQQHDSLADG